MAMKELRRERERYGLGIYRSDVEVRLALPGAYATSVLREVCA